MEEHELDLSAEPSLIVDSVASREAELRDGEGHHHGGPIETVREATYKGHNVVVRTTYAISVDGTPVEGHLGVSNDGQVHYHAIPNLGFSSAVELVQKLIDTFPEDFGDHYGDDGAADGPAPGAGHEAPDDGDEAPPPEHEHPEGHDRGAHDHGEDAA